MLYKVSHTCYKSAAADGYNNCINIGKLFDYFKADCALPCDNIGVIVGMNECITFLITQFNCLIVCIVINALDHTHLCTVFLCGFNL